MKIKLSKTEWFIFLSFGLILFIIPYLFTQPWGIFPIDDVGGTIGGVTAPFLGFFGSILVYMALKSQVEANQNIQQQFSKQELDSKIEKRSNYFKNRISIIQFEINDFLYSYFDKNLKDVNQKLNYTGSQAIHKLLNNSKENYYGKSIRTPYELEPKLIELRSLLVFFDLTINDLKNDEIIYEDYRKECLDLLKFLFVSKIKGNFESVEKYMSVHNEACVHNCGYFHGIPNDLFKLVNDIKIKLDASYNVVLL